MNADKKGDTDYKYADVTHGIINAAFEVQNTLGCGFLEKVYENALVYEMEMRHYKVEPQKSINVHYKGRLVGDYTADIIINDKVVLELKAVEQITKIHKAQLINYLKATGYQVGLILNFAKPRLEYVRLVLTDFPPSENKS
ncbi:MAG: GxxExxY protein [Candidatus Aureabacteria bacterium]|nr:GxxExxY protein [Candidatus Auribacterota bacterium]